MRTSLLKSFLASAVLFLVNRTMVAQPVPPVTKPSTPSGRSPTKTDINARAEAKAKAKAALRAKQIDLNSASKEELAKIPGISDDIAARIIAGRPYLTKSNLVTHKIIPLDLYLAIKDQVAAKQKAVTK